MFKVVQEYTANASEIVRINVADKICARFPRVQRDYVLRCFNRYPRVVFCYKKDQLHGLFFYDFFDENGHGYFYFGPLFFFTRGAFAYGASKIVLQTLKRFSRVYFLGELQNPELIIHLQTVLRRHIFPKPFTFAISDHARTVVRKFQSRIVQLDDIDVTTFASQSTSTLFYGNRKSNLMTQWLFYHGVDLANNQALVLLIDLTYRQFLAVTLNIIFRYLTYPSHKAIYLETIDKLMRERHENQISAPAYYTDHP